MKFTIALLDLENLIKTACSPRSRKKDILTLMACGGRIQVEGKGTVASMEAAVIKDGAVTIHAQSFRKVLDTYKGTKVLEFEGGKDGLRIQTFRMGIVCYEANPKP